ncbi:hypothetical protein ACWEO1_16805 [Kitasatospora cineracea]
MNPPAPADTPAGRLLHPLAAFVLDRIAERAADPSIPPAEREEEDYARLHLRIAQLVALADATGPVQQVRALHPLLKMSTLWADHPEHPNTPLLRQVADLDPEAALDLLHRNRTRAAAMRGPTVNHPDGQAS